MTLFQQCHRQWFAGRLEEDYFEAGNRLNCSLQRDKNGNYASKDTLVNLILTPEGRCVLFDVPEFGVPTVSAPERVTGTVSAPDSAYRSVAKLPFTTKVYVYDSMNKDDKVLGYAGSNNLAPVVFSDGRVDVETLAGKAWTMAGMVPEAEKAGSKAAASFLPTWKEDSFFVIYYDGAEQAWNRAAEFAYRYRWKEAMDEWMTLLQNRNKDKRACAAYNIGLACFMLGQPELALEWLDRSDRDTPVSLSRDLREKIKNYTGKQ